LKHRFAFDGILGERSGGAFWRGPHSPRKLTRWASTEELSPDLNGTEKRSIPKWRNGADAKPFDGEPLEEKDKGATTTEIGTAPAVS
jgi:hypothetical protein